MTLAFPSKAACHLSYDSAMTTALATRLPTTSSLSPLLIACLAATWLVWGSTYLAIKYALISFPPYFQMGTRFLVAGGLLLAWMRWRGTPMPNRAEWRCADLRHPDAGGWAPQCRNRSLRLVVAFIAVLPLMIALVNLCYGVRPGRLEAAGIAVGVVGVLMLTQGASFQASTHGLIAVTVACVSWSVGSVLSQRSLPLAPGAMGFASEMVCGGAVLLGLSVLTGEAPVWPPESIAVAAWVFLVVFGSLIAFNAYMVLWLPRPGWPPATPSSTR
jgi:drug/metabolite transporter (DMT)-like permease